MVRLSRTVEIETTRPELIPACVALVAHPDDERYQAAVRKRRRHAAVRHACAGKSSRAGRSRQGQRHRDDLHVRRPDRRHVVARAEFAGAGGDSAGRHASRRELAGAGVGIDRPGSRPAVLWRPGAPVGREGARARGRTASRVGRSGGRAAADYSRREVFTRRAIARSRSSRAASGSSRPSSSATNCSSAGAS